jgi:hypothetical protein
VPFQGNIVVFSAPLMFRDKAQWATNGFSIGKRCNAVARHQGSAHWVSLSAPMDCVVPLGKGAARAGPMSAANAVGLPCKARLAMNADKLTEYDNITLKGHMDRCC